jgi:Tol biopolymer transport system component
VATTVLTSGGTIELWVYDLETKAQTTVLTRGIPFLPRWWPDSRRIVFTETVDEPPFQRAVVRQVVESTGQRDTLGASWEMNDISPDTLTAVGIKAYGKAAWIIPLRSSAEATVLDSYPNAWGPTYSRDGRWIAYTSNESGPYEIYAIDATRKGERLKISRAGGEEPRFTRRGDELVYRWGQDWFAVSVPGPGSSAFGPPRAIFRGPYVNVAERSHDVTSDSKRHLVILGPLEQTATHLNVVTNWVAEVARKVGR